MSKILITGITGFAGSHLAEYLIDKGDQISGTYLSEGGLLNILKIRDKLDLHKINLLEEGTVNNLVSSLKPDVIFHLAALPSPAASFNNPAEFLSNNINSQVNLLEAVKNSKISPRILIVSSAEIYGLVEEKDLPINENTTYNPTSPYAVSKIAQDYLGLQYYISSKLEIIRVRPFNHVGPRLSPDFAPSAFAKKIAEIEKGKRDPVLTVGNLEPRRDFTDVRDMVRAYSLLVDKGEAGQAYNAGSGKSMQISEILEILKSYSSVDFEITREEALYRLNDIPELRCDAAKLHQATGWSPEIEIKRTLKDTLDYWREVV